VVSFFTRYDFSTDTAPGEITTPYPTLINLSVEWKIEGDGNRNGTAEFVSG
jgi:hypothetical protein